MKLNKYLKRCTECEKRKARIPNQENVFKDKRKSVLFLEDVIISGTNNISHVQNEENIYIYREDFSGRRT